LKPRQIHFLTHLNGKAVTISLMAEALNSSLTQTSLRQKRRCLELHER